MPPLPTKVQAGYYYDSDGDGLDDTYVPDPWEDPAYYGYSTPPSDQDGDGWEDALDPFPADARLNPQTDPDADGVPSELEWFYGMNDLDPADGAADLDGDGFSNAEAFQQGWVLDAALVSPVPDLDGDRLNDITEAHWAQVHPGSLDPGNPLDPVADYDQDGVMNFEELTWGLDLASPTSPATGEDLAFMQLVTGDYAAFVTPGYPGYSATDPDADGLPSLLEYQLQLNPRSADSNEDGVPDGEEDSDGDGFGNLAEIQAGTDPGNGTAASGLAGSGTGGGTGTTAETGETSGTGSNTGESTSSEPHQPPPVFTVVGVKHDLSGGDGTEKVPAVPPEPDDYQSGIGHAAFLGWLYLGYEVVWHDRACGHDDEPGYPSAADTPDSADPNAYYDSSYFNDYYGYLADSESGGGGVDPSTYTSSSTTDTSTDTSGDCTWSVIKYGGSGGSDEQPATGTAFEASRCAGDNVTIDDEETVKTHYDPLSPFSGELTELGFENDAPAMDGGSEGDVSADIDFQTSDTMQYPSGNWAAVWVKADRAVDKEENVVVPVTASTGATAYAVFTIPEGQKTSTQVTLDNGSAVWTKTDESAYPGCLQLAPPATEGQQNSVAAGAAEQPKIEPGPDMAGVIGDMVPSTKGAMGEKHFVTPKKAGAYVILKATGVSASDFSSKYQWEGAEPDPADPLQAKVKRDTANKIPVKIKTVTGGKEAAKMNVWVVWASLDQHSLSPVSTPQYSSQGFWGWDQTAAGMSVRYQSVWKIQPREIITDSSPDRPDLRGKHHVPPDVPGTGIKHFQSGVDLKNGVNGKWDVSRKVRAKLIKPPNVGANAFPGGVEPRSTDFPNETLIGNDDYETRTEKNDPYIAESINPGKLPVIPEGSLFSTDTPAYALFHQEGSVGDSVE